MTLESSTPLTQEENAIIEATNWKCFNCYNSIRKGQKGNHNCCDSRCTCLVINCHDTRAAYVKRILKNRVWKLPK